MGTWYYTVIFLSIVLLAYLIWKEVTRPLHLRLLWRIVSSIITIISLSCLAFDISFTTNEIITTDKRLLLLTDGNNKEGNSEKLLFNGEPLIGTIEQAPHYLIDNEYILSGYRINFNTFWRIFKR